MTRNQQPADECAKCGAPSDPDYGHVGDCAPQPAKFLGYGPCLCVLTKYCDGYCNPIYEQIPTRTDATT